MNLEVILKLTQSKLTPDELVNYTIVASRN